MVGVTGKGRRGQNVTGQLLSPIVTGEFPARQARLEYDVTMRPSYSVLHVLGCSLRDFHWDMWDDWLMMSLA